MINMWYTQWDGGWQDARLEPKYTQWHQCLDDLAVVFSAPRTLSLLLALDVLTRMDKGKSGNLLLVP
jgi:hypothetical protein